MPKNSGKLCQELKAGTLVTLGMSVKQYCKMIIKPGNNKCQQRHARNSYFHAQILLQNNNKTNNHRKQNILESKTNFIITNKCYDICKCRKRWQQLKALHKAVRYEQCEDHHFIHSYVPFEARKMLDKLKCKLLSNCKNDNHTSYVCAQSLT